MQALTPSAGRPWPLGATVDALGVNFAVFSAHATAVELCLYDPRGEAEVQRAPLVRSGDLWHAHLAGAGPGLVYGLRAQGPWAPSMGQRFNPHKLLLDPYARETVGSFRWDAAHRGDTADGQMDRQDNGATALKARVVRDTFDWGDDAAPRTPWGDSVLYEMHVRGFSQQHPGVPEAQRGTYAGLASDAAIAHLQRLGVTAVSLLPVQQYIDEQRLVRMGLRNYWGYNTLAFFCPEARYASEAALRAGGQAVRDEFRQMVRRLHAAGIEVILDVVYNHTAETDEFGPTLSWRGLDNASYYLLRPGDARHYDNHSGCGNTLNLSQPRVLQMVMDSLRYWVQEMHVDGFRFDLATVLGRDAQGFDRHAAFFACIAQDPLLAGVKLIAEPWDIGPGGYQLGQFPPGWVEWNDRFRDTARAWWLRGDGTRAEFARRWCASSELFRPAARAPAASLNYVVSHDGFTLRDLVSYDRRHNQANGEDNRDGHAHNLSWNCGIEGPTGDPAVQALRARLQRALLATLLLAQGTPMLAAGDELGHTQQGNNNPYCQDNPITWIDWSQADDGLIDFCAALIRLRRQIKPLGDRWYDDAVDPSGNDGLRWLQPDGEALQGERWHDPAARAFGLRVGPPGDGGAPLLLLVNAGAQGVDFRLPAGRWRRLLDSAASSSQAGTSIDAPTYPLAPRCVCLLRLEA
ncbi:MAG: glycogen debranching protein GlgX [Rubrivivax sp.]|nr:glycogen debranching protein GlgX [Rubrivivax sp.]